VIRFALRQFRTQGTVALGALIVLGVVLAITGPHLVHLYDTIVVGCQKTGNCGLAQSTLTSSDGHLLSWLNVLVVVVPGIIGIFWGAPLIAREREAGTFRLAWTQSVTRTRWLAIKVGVVGLASMAVAGLLSWMVTWWSSPIDRVNANQFATFDGRDLVPVAYAAFAFALGMTIGLLVRRSLPAMAATLVGFVAVRLAIYEWVRPRLAAPVRIVAPLLLPQAKGNGPVSLGTGVLKPGDWVLSQQTINASGHVVGNNGALAFDINVGPSGTITLGDGQVCPNKVPTFVSGSGHGGNQNQTVPHAVQECITRLHFKQVLTYQPASRYWPFQWAETAIFVALALLLVGFCFWWMRHNFTGKSGRGVGDRTRVAESTAPRRRELANDRSGTVFPEPLRQDGPPVTAGRPNPLTVAPTWP
jgi:hypothetical protein